ncbi:DNA methylase [Echinicola strongylocentroti]|uniref:Methyltransferase n=1 Tax=Echinicola strongylocentroti TaxID=1795355 RepID=A0A2Z4IP79_9BACT|nr:DNA methyltransferase [Echinicola strongylocentroti]AWW32438.1 DNA methylase [Echinicola strongylocentroti]
MKLQDKVIKAEKVDWRSLKWLQSEELKTPVEIDKLVESLMKNHLIRGFHIWEDLDGERWILDGHHMKMALERIDKDGLMEIPDLLTGYFINCADRKEAGRIVLLHSASYAKLSATGVMDHLASFDLDLDELGTMVSLDAFDFGSVEQLALDELNRANGLDEDAEDGFESILPKEGVTKEGDLYELVSGSGMVHRIICGDSTRAEVVERLLDGQKPVLVVTDPPYGVNYDPNWRPIATKGKIKSTGKVKNDDQADWAATYPLFDAQVMYVWHSAIHSNTVYQNLIDCGYKIISQIIWNKQSPAMSRGDYHWKHEPCWYAVKKGQKHNWQGSRKELSVWDIKNLSAKSVQEEEGQTGHGTQKPIECMRKPMANNSKIGQIVADPFLGSGSSLIAAEQLHRILYASELDPRYVDVEVTRWINWMEKQGVNWSVRLNGVELNESEIKEITENVERAISAA